MKRFNLVNENVDNLTQNLNKKNNLGQSLEVYGPSKAAIFC